MFAVAQIADGIGRLVCHVIGAILAKCQTGQPVADIGYSVVLLILVCWGVYVMVTRATG
jgi:hypothetical protein